MNRDILQALPIDGAVIDGPNNRQWTVQVIAVQPPGADNTRWILDVHFDGRPSYDLSLIVHSETVYGQHEAGDARWLLDVLRTWLFSPDIEKSQQLMIQP